MIFTIYHISFLNIKIRDDSYKICHDDSSERCVIEDEMIEDEIITRWMMR